MTVVIGEEHRQSTIAALGDVVGNAGNDDAREASHSCELDAEQAGVN